MTVEHSKTAFTIISMLGSGGRIKIAVNYDMFKIETLLYPSLVSKSSTTCN